MAEPKTPEPKTPESKATGSGPADRSSLGRQIATGARGLVVPVLAIFSALVIGAFVIVLSDITFFERLSADPGAALGGAVDEVLAAYGALFTGALGSPTAYVDAFTSGDLDQG